MGPVALSGRRDLAYGRGMVNVDRRTGIEVLDRDQCLALLAATDFGRIGLDEGGHPLILPINYAMDGDDVVFRTAEGTKLDAARQPACFEIDEHDSQARTGWSVVVRGRLEEVTAKDKDLFDRVADLAKPWAEGDKPHVLRLVAESIQGRRVT